MQEPVNVQRKLQQLDNDVHSIYDILATITTVQAEHTVRLDGIDIRLDGIDGRLDGIDGRLDGIDGRLDGIDGRLDGIDGRLDSMYVRFDGIDGKLDTVLELLQAGGSR